MYQPPRPTLKQVRNNCTYIVPQFDVHLKDLGEFGYAEENRYQLKCSSVEDHQVLVRCFRSPHVFSNPQADERSAEPRGKPHNHPDPLLVQAEESPRRPRKEGEETVGCGVLRVEYLPEIAGRLQVDPQFEDQSDVAVVELVVLKNSALIQRWLTG